MERMPKRQAEEGMEWVRRRRKQWSRGSCLTSPTEVSQVYWEFTVYVCVCVHAGAFWINELSVSLSRATLSLAEWRESCHGHKEDLRDLASSPWLLAARWYHTVSLMPLSWLFWSSVCLFSADTAIHFLASLKGISFVLVYFIVYLWMLFYITENIMYILINIFNILYCLYYLKCTSSQNFRHTV